MKLNKLKVHVTVEVTLEALEEGEVELSPVDAYGVVNTAMSMLHQEGYDSDKFAFDYQMMGTVPIPDDITICDECGNAISVFNSSEVSRDHDVSCSLHPHNEA